MKNHAVISLLLGVIIFSTAFFRRQQAETIVDQYHLSTVGEDMILATCGKVFHEHELDVPAHLTPFLFLKIPVNSADRSLLMSIPGIGASMAERIIAYRQNHGPIENGRTMLKVKGVGPRKLETLENHITYEQHEL